MGALLSCALVTRYGSGEPLNFFAAHRPGGGEPAAPRRQSLLRAQARYALLPAATPREGRFAPRRTLPSPRSPGQLPPTPVNPVATGSLETTSQDRSALRGNRASAA